MTTTRVEIYDPFSAAEQVRIVSIDASRTPVLKVEFSDGARREVDFSDLVARSKWFRTLGIQTTFEDVEIIHGGRALQWVTGTDYCADALRILGDRQLAEREAS